jgi:hypothetical protein
MGAACLIGRSGEARRLSGCLKILMGGKKLKGVCVNATPEMVKKGMYEEMRGREA